MSVIQAGIQLANNELISSATYDSILDKYWSVQNAAYLLDISHSRSESCVFNSYSIRQAFLIEILFLIEVFSRYDVATIMLDKVDAVVIDQNYSR